MSLFSDFNGGRTLSFVGFTPTIINCGVLETFAGRALPVYRVATSAYGSSFLTRVMDARNDAPIAQVDWRDPPAVEIRERVGRVDARHWLRRSDDRR